MRRRGRMSKGAAAPLRELQEHSTSMLQALTTEMRFNHWMYFLRNEITFASQVALARILCQPDLRCQNDIFLVLLVKLRTLIQQHKGPSCIQAQSYEKNGSARFVPQIYLVRTICRHSPYFSSISVQPVQSYFSFQFCAFLRFIQGTCRFMVATNSYFLIVFVFEFSTTEGKNMIRK